MLQISIAPAALLCAALCLAGASPALAQTTIAQEASLRLDDSSNSPDLIATPDMLAIVTNEDSFKSLRTWANNSFFREEQDADIDADDAPKTYPWELSLELGGNGSRGNTDEDNINASIRAHREKPKTSTDFGADYRFSQTDSTNTKNQAYLFGRREWPIKSPFTIFVATTFEFDEFKDFDLRWAANAGLGFQAIAKENVKLQLYVGSGFSKEFGSNDDDAKPEALFGLLYRNKLNANTNLTGMAEYYPNLEAFIDDYRLRGELALEVALTEGKDWWLKLFVEDQYDDTPEGAEANDFYYGVSILFKF